MRETPEQFAQLCLDKRGYVVLGFDKPQRRGHIALGSIDLRNGAILVHPLVVVAATDLADFIEQLKLAAEYDDATPLSSRVLNAHYYRAVAE